MTLLLSILSGVIASIIFFLLNLLVRPHIRVSDKVRLEKITSKPDKIHIKVVNLSRSRLVDVDYVLTKYIQYSDGNSEAIEIAPCRNDKLRVIEAYSNHDSNYAVRISYPIEDDFFDTKDSDSKITLVFTIQAKHSISGTLSTKTYQYEKSDMKQGYFGTGKVMDIFER